MSALRHPAHVYTTVVSHDLKHCIESNKDCTRCVFNTSYWGMSEGKCKFEKVADDAKRQGLPFDDRRPKVASSMRKMELVETFE